MKMNLLYEYKPNRKRKEGGRRLKGITKNKIKSEALVNVIICTYNAEDYLEETIKSVIVQTYKNIRIIIIDGNSKDQTISIILKYEKFIDYWFSEPDRGIYDAMNKGIHFSYSGYLTFLNAGDLYSNKTSIEELFKNIDYDETDVVYGNIYILKKNGEYIGESNYKKFDLNTLKKYGTGTVCHQSIFVKKSIAPYYDSSLRIKGELNWYFDICENNPNLKVKRNSITIACYRLGGYSYDNFCKDTWELIKVFYRRFGLFTLYRYFKITHFDVIESRYRYIKIIFNLTGNISNFIKRLIKAFIYFIGLLFTPLLFIRLAFLKYNGYLKEIGWIESIKKINILNSKCRPMPAYSYPFLTFFSSRLNNNMKVFEYGGTINSNLFFSNKVKSFTSLCEQDISNIRLLKPLENIKIVNDNKLNSKEYSKTILSNGIKYNIIILNGINKKECFNESVKVLEKDGIIIINNVSKDYIKSEIENLNGNKFKSIIFSGLCPGSIHTCNTYVLYNKNNCLQI